MSILTTNSTILFEKLTSISVNSDYYANAIEKSLDLTIQHEKIRNKIKFCRFDYGLVAIGVHNAESLYDPKSEIVALLYSKDGSSLSFTTENHMLDYLVDHPFVIQINITCIINKEKIMSKAVKRQKAYLAASSHLNACEVPSLIQSVQSCDQEPIKPDYGRFPCKTDSSASQSAVVATSAEEKFSVNLQLTAAEYRSLVNSVPDEILKLILRGKQA